MVRLTDTDTDTERGLKKSCLVPVPDGDIWATRIGAIVAVMLKTFFRDGNAIMGQFLYI